MAQHVPLKARRVAVASALVAAFAALYLVLRTNDPTAVDGALRCVDVLRPESTLLHGNNHLLYPVWVRTWVAAVAALGVPVGSPWDIIRAVQAMNALFAAGSVALLYAALSEIADDRVALTCSLVFGLSAAVLAHATSSAEPVIGLFFAVTTLWLLVQPTEAPDSVGRLWFAGVSLSLTLASYQGMATVAGVAALIVVWGMPPRRLTTASIPGVTRKLGWVAGGGLVGLAVIYGGSYLAQGIPLRDVPARFFALGGAPQVYSGFAAGRFANLPIGLIKNIYGLPSAYAGLKSLPSLDGYALARIASGLLLWSIGACLVAQGYLRSGRAAGIWFLVGSSLALSFLLFPLCYWDPLYDKLWLLPGAAGTLPTAMALRRESLQPRATRILFGVLLAFVAIEAIAVVPAAARRHVAPTPHLADARALDGLISPSDSVVLDFDPTSSLWLSLFRRDQRVLLLPAAAPHDAEVWLRDSAARSGSRIVFVSVLDQDRSTWDAFLGSRVGIPYALLDPYRNRSRVLGTFGEPAHAFTVRAFAP